MVRTFQGWSRAGRDKCNSYLPRGKSALLPQQRGRADPPNRPIARAEVRLRAASASNEEPDQNLMAGGGAIR